MDRSLSDRDGVSEMVAGRRVGRRRMSIGELLEWAFQRELVSLDFDEIQTVSGMSGAGVGVEYILMERAMLGCRVDGGGRSDPHPDAEIVASALAAIPDVFGGRRAAIWVADLARSGRAPDWMQDAVPRLYPVDWRTNRYGRHAKTDDASGLGVYGWPHQARRNRKGVIVHDVVHYCPCYWAPTASTIASARRAYLDWWNILRELRATFQMYGGLMCHDVTDEMPPMQPWKKNA